MKTKQLLLTLCLMVHFHLSAQDISPRRDGALFSIKVGGLLLEADSSYGAKVSSLSIEESEFMVTAAMVSSDFLWGSTLWPSPQGEWGWNDNKLKWDHQAFTPSIEGDTMSFTGPDVSVDNGDSFYFIKKFWANANDTTFSLHYSMENTTGKAIKKALWELTRVPVGGLTFWPTGPAGTWGDLASATEEIDGHTWYLREDEDGTGLKFFADGKDGWLAHVDDQNRIFVKCFEDVKSSDFADGEGEIELWVADDYIELENQSSCKSIAHGDRLDYKVKWYLRQLPDHILVSSGSKDLVDYVLWLISEKETPPTSVNPEAMEPDFRLFANRSEGILHVIPGEINRRKTEQCEFTYSIYKLRGALVLRGRLQGEKINISSMTEGLYIIRLQSNKTTLCRLINLF